MSHMTLQEWIAKEAAGKPSPSMLKLLAQKTVEAINRNPKTSVALTAAGGLSLANGVRVKKNKDMEVYKRRFGDGSPTNAAVGGLVTGGMIMLPFLGYKLLRDRSAGPLVDEDHTVQ